MKMKKAIRKKQEGSLDLLKYVQALSDLKDIQALLTKSYNKFNEEIEKYKLKFQSKRINLYNESERILLIIQMNRAVPLFSLGKVKYNEGALFHSLEELRKFAIQFRELEEIASDRFEEFFEKFHKDMHIKMTKITEKFKNASLKEQTKAMKKEAIRLAKVINEINKFRDKVRLDFLVRESRLNGKLTNFYRKRSEALNDFFYHKISHKDEPRELLERKYKKKKVKPPKPHYIS